jgi:protein-S-isoprenylcysteine O-methyltransferase Ste14
MPTQDPATTTIRPNSLQRASSSTAAIPSILATACSTSVCRSCTTACGPIVLVPVVAYLDRVIDLDEASLEARFGRMFETYSQDVRRWL